MSEGESPNTGPHRIHKKPSSESSSTRNASTTPHSKVVSFRRDSGDVDVVHEQSPLLAGRGSEEDGQVSDLSPLAEDWQNEEHETKSSWYMFLLTLGGLGLQIAWSVEMSYGSPYLLSLGLSKSLLALVWIAGPLSGVLVQPYVGIKSDRSQIRWGKRRPFILGGVIATTTSLMILAWTREIVAGFLQIFGADPSSNGVAVTIILFAVLFVYVLDFAINVMQAGLRAFIVDCAPTHQQESANAWISRLSGVGNILGMICGFINLPEIFPFFGDTQFKVLCALAAITMLSTVGISIASVPERDPTLHGPPPPKDEGIIALFATLFRAVFRLPPQISKICIVQFFAWMGWFPFLFYTTTYIGEIYVEPFFQANPHMSEDEVNKLWDQGTRRGTLALLIYAITTFIASIVLPFLIAPTYEPPIPVHDPAVPLTPTTPGSISAGGYFHTHRRRVRNLHSHVANVLMRGLSSLQIPGLTLRRAWFWSHIVFTTCMWLTFLVRSLTFATILVAVVGIPWAMTQWAPFALISAEISKRDAIRRGLLRAPPTPDGALLAAQEDDATEDQAGVVLGIHNVAISAPQVLATLMSSVIFSFLQKKRGEPGDESVAWCFRLGGLCALGAAWLTLRVGEEGGDLTVAAGGRLDEGSGETVRMLEEPREEG